MKRGILVLVSAAVLMSLLHVMGSTLAIRHRTIAWEDVLRGDRNVTVAVSVRRDREIQSMAEMIDLPVVILSHGNTVKHNEYSFLVNALAVRGYLVASIQHDLETDDPMVTRVGEEYVGRRMQYNRGNFNILFAIDKLKEFYPNADYKHLTLVGHSNGGDISMYFAKLHPETVKKVITLDNLRVPLLRDPNIKVLSFRSKDPQFKPDPGVVPDDEECRKAGIHVVRTEFQHNELSDRGPVRVKSFIAEALHKFLDDIGDETEDPLVIPRLPRPASITSAVADSTASRQN